MAYYRIYCFGSDEHIKEFAETHCESDGDAVVEAQPLLSRFRRVEVWDRGRFVERLEMPAGLQSIAQVAERPVLRPVFSPVRVPRLVYG